MRSARADTARRVAATLAAIAAVVASERAGADDDGSPPDQELLLHVAVPDVAAVTSAVAEIQRPGDPRYVELLDDGSVAGDLPHDGVFTGRDRGPYARLLPVRLLLGIDGEEPTVVYEGLVRTVDARQDAAAWRLEYHVGGWSAQPTATAFAGRPAAAAEGLPRLVAFGWGLLVVVAVATLARRRGERGGPPAGAAPR